LFRQPNPSTVTLSTFEKVKLVVYYGILFSDVSDTFLSAFVWPLIKVISVGVMTHGLT